MYFSICDEVSIRNYKLRGKNMLHRNVFGVDLGTSSIKIYSLKKNEIKVEKNMKRG